MKRLFYQIFNTPLYPILSVLLVTLSFGQLARFSYFDRQINFYIYEFILLIAVMYVSLTNRNICKDTGVVGKRLILFIVYMSVSLLISVFYYSFIQNIVALLYLLRIWLYALFFLCLYRTVEFDKSVLVKWSCNFLLFITIVTSFLQYFLYPDLRNLEYLGWDPHLYRMFGLYFEPSFAAAIYGLLLLFVLFNRHYFKLKILAYGIILTLLSMIFLTYSRGAYLGVIITAGVFALQKKKWKEIIIFLVIFIFVLFFLPKKFGEGVNLMRISTINSRTEDYKLAVTIWKKSPLLGIGYNHIRYEKLQLDNNPDLYNSHSGASFHSSFLIVLVTGGIIGLALFMYFLFGVIQLSSFSFFATLYISILSLTDNVFFQPFVLCIYLIFVVFSLSHLSYKQR